MSVKHSCTDPANSISWIDKESGERKEKTEWHNVVCKNRQAEIAVQYLNKGDRIGIEGRLSTRSYEKNGVTHYVTEIICSNLQIVSTKEKVADNLREELSIPPSELDDDLPF